MAEAVGIPLTKKDYLLVFLLTIGGLILGLVIARKTSDLLAAHGVPISTGDIGKVPIGGGAASGIRPAS